MKLRYFLHLGALMLLTASQACAQEIICAAWDHRPFPGGMVTASVRGKERDIVVYQVKATDKDTCEDVNGNLSLRGDGTVDMYPHLGFTDPGIPRLSSGKCEAFQQTAYDETDGRREYSVTVRLRLTPGKDTVTVVDTWWSGDKRAANDPRRDRTPDGADLRTEFGVTVIIDHNKGEVKGKVQQSGGQPIAGASMGLWATDPDFLADIESTEMNPDGLPSWTDGMTDETGSYRMEFWATAVEVQAIEPYAAESQIKPASIPREGSAIVDFIFENADPPEPEPPEAEAQPLPQGDPRYVGDLVNPSSCFPRVDNGGIR